MHMTHAAAILALSVACTFTALVVVWVVRARRLNVRDCCAWCGDQLGLESRHRFHARSVCARCWQRLRVVMIRRVVRIAVLLTVWLTGAVSLAELVGENDPSVMLWAPVFGALVLAALIAGALPPFKRGGDQTAATLRRLHALQRGGDETS